MSKLPLRRERRPLTWHPQQTTAAPVPTLESLPRINPFVPSLKAERACALKVVVCPQLGFPSTERQSKVDVGSEELLSRLDVPDGDYAHWFRVGRSVAGGEDDDGVGKAGVVDEGDGRRNGYADVGQVRRGEGEGVGRELWQVNGKYE